MKFIGKIETKQERNEINELWYIGREHGRQANAKLTTVDAIFKALGGLQNPEIISNTINASFKHLDYSFFNGVL
jgi:hypothetical protein